MATGDYQCPHCGQWNGQHSLECITNRCCGHSNPSFSDNSDTYVKKFYNVEKTELPVPEWDEVFMRDVYAIARRSKDPRTKIGAVLVHWNEKVAFSRGYNGFPRKVVETPERWERPEKYFWVKHAEENAILNCSRKGHATEGAILFTQGIPCANCAGDVIQAGLKEVVVHQQWQTFERTLDWKKWNESTERSSKMLEEVGIKVRVYDQFLGVQAMLNGKVIEV